MSTATTTTSPNITHLPHTPHTPHVAHPIPLREQAFALHCQGLRSPAIAAELGVPERTIRSWIAAALDDLKDDIQLNRRQQLLLAVERQHQLTATAWQQFHHEAAARDALLDAALETLLAGTDSSGASAQNVSIRLPASTPAPRYLSLIIQADKEVNRLLGLYTLARLHLLAPDTPDTPDTPDVPADDPSPIPTSDIPAESATDVPAESATVPSSLAADCVGASGWTSAEVDANAHIPAESATVSTPQCPSVSSVSSVVNRLSPAESATDSQSAQADFVAAGPPGAVSTAGLAVGIRPTNRHPTRMPQPWMM